MGKFQMTNNKSQTRKIAFGIWLLEFVIYAFSIFAGFAGGMPTIS